MNIDDVLKRFKAKIDGAAAVVDERSVVEAYARWAPIYDALFGLATWGGRRAVAGAVNALPPGRVLEAGVGTGMSLPSYDRRHRVTGIDLSPDMLERAERRVERKELGHVDGLRLMDAAALAFPDQSFDATVAAYVITVVPEPHRVLAELVRVTRRGGRIVVINHFASERGWRARIERGLARFSAALGWRPDFPIDRVTEHPELKLIERRTVAPFGLFTLLVFERP